MTPSPSAGGGIITDPNFANVVFLSDFPGVDGATTLTEESSSARTVTFVGNAQIDTAQFKWSPSSLLLDGTGDIVTCVNSADFQFGSGSWTVEGWVRFASLPGAGIIAALAALYDTNNQRSWACDFDGSTGNWNTFVSTNGTSSTSITAATTVSLNTWYFVEFNADGANVRTFENGIFKGKTAFSSTLFASTAKLSIGGLLSSGSPLANFTHNGWIGGVRITKGTCRHPSDSNYTAPTTPFPRS